MAQLNITTKYDVGNEVYFMSGEKPTKRKIQGFRLSIGKNEGLHEKSDGGTIEKPLIRYDMGVYESRLENEVFPTKEALFAHLEGLI